MPSSTSASEKAFVRSALAGFAGALLLVLVPYEVLVRAAERKWGMEPARIAPRQNGTPHVDMFLEDLAAGIRYPLVAVGTSRVENGVRPDVMEPIVGPTYNLGIGSGSSIVTLEVLESLHIHPPPVILCVFPVGSTPLGAHLGQK